MFVDNMVTVFREVRRVLRADGTLWLNLGDSYATGAGKVGNCPGGGAQGEAWRGGPPSDKSTLRGNGHVSGGPKLHKLAPVPNRGVHTTENSGKHGPRIAAMGPITQPNRMPQPNLKPKDLCGIPWRVAFALQSDGWWLRQDIIWCLSGGAWVYARTQKGDMPMMVRDLARLKPGTAQLWNGSKWTALLGMSKSARRGDELEIVLRSGERISCTPTHRFPTDRGLLDASDLRRGDVMETCRLPQPEAVRDCAIDEDAAWFAGLYLAEGSRSDDCIQIAGHAREEARWERVQRVAIKFGGSATQTIEGNGRQIRIHGRVLNAIIDELVAGRTAADKGFSPVVWRYSDAFVASMLTGYLSGDGHWDAKNKRWRLWFARNYNLERDLRVACARLGYHLSLRPSVARYQGGTRPAFRGELRMERSGHLNQRDMGEIVEVRKARCREVYDLGVADEPHLFALASGVLTHNSKPNPMPESVTDRCTKAHEYLFLLSKSERYYYDADAIKEAAFAENEHDLTGAGMFAPGQTPQRGNRKIKMPDGWDTGAGGHGSFHRKGREKGRTREVPPRHQAWESSDRSSLNEVGRGMLRNKRSVWEIPTSPFPEAHFATFPPALIEPCILAGCPKGGTILDPFFGAGTTGLVADRLQRDCIGIELNPAYAEMARKRIVGDAPLFVAAE